jgi:glycosyltransferase involved in cell wall biosynthesis
MRIGINAHLIRHLYSGVECSLYDLVNALVARNRDHQFMLYISRRAHAEHFAEMPGIIPRTTAFSDDRRLRRIAWEQCALPVSADRDKLDLLHCPGYIVPLCCRVPMVVTIPDVIALKHPEYCPRGSVLYSGFFLPASAGRARRIITQSECSKKDIIRHCRVKEDAVDVVRLAAHEMFKPVRDEIAVQELRAKYGLPGGVILFVGNLEPKKNIERLIEAFHMLKRKHVIEHTLAIAGHRGISYARLRSRVERLGLGASVKFMGYMPRRELPILYSLADVFVFPSLYEGFGLPPLEAMCCGTPVVASNAASLPEVVGDAAVLVDPYDAGDIANGIFKVITSPGLKSDLVRRGCRRAAEFSWERTADSTLRIYEKCITAIR